VLINNSLKEACHETWTFSGIWTVWLSDIPLDLLFANYMGFTINRNLCHCVLFYTSFTVSVLCGCNELDSYSKTDLPYLHCILHNTCNCWLYTALPCISFTFVEYGFCGACIFTVLQTCRLQYSDN